ncbi:MAG: hypothetical protein R3A51_13625 [Nannocystaceae bacterium]|nr:c-type cytochrome [Myxococcales bacterium]
MSLALFGCDEVIDLDPIDVSIPVESSVRPPPITGGTLVVLDNATAVAADPDRDVIHVVDLAFAEVLHTIALEPGDQPGRVVVSDSGLVHVVLRGYGGLATIDVDAGAVLSRTWLCTEPRGVAFNPDDATLHVACADGWLHQLDEDGASLGSTQLEPDLRDVMIVNGVVMASLFRKAAIVGVDGSRIELPPFGDHIPHVAWRTWVRPSGTIVMLHQLASTEPVPIEPDPEDIEVDGGTPYGGGGDPCTSGITGAAITTIFDGRTDTVPVSQSRLTVDAAASPSGEWIALAVPGAAAEEGTIRFQSTEFFECDPGARPDGDDGQVTAVAYSASGQLVAQSREPATITVFTDEPWGTRKVIKLNGEPRFDTGHEIFHRATSSGLSCASCHPEGTDDGHVWTFETLGDRRTQPLDVGLGDTAPFHWDGDMTDLTMIMDEVLSHRMGGDRQSSLRQASFQRWLFAQQRPPAGGDHEEPSQVSAGAQLFASYDCGRCHDGPALGGTITENVRGVRLQVPTLRRVSLHAPYMHDGRSGTLEAAIQDMVESTRGVTAPQADIDAIAAYLRTL